MHSKMAGLIITCSLIIACSHYDKNPYTPEVKKFYEAAHNLRKMFNKEESVTVKTPSEGSMSGGFFLFLGIIDGSYKEGTTVEHNITYVRFAWEFADSTYAIASVPLDRVRVRIVEKIEVPTVSFSLDETALSDRFDELTSNNATGYDYQARAVEKFSELRLLRNNYDAPEFINEHMNYLKYAVITCSSSDWPQNISLPLNQ